MTKGRAAAETIPFELKSNLIMVDALLDGSPRRLVLDTGASQTVLTPRGAEGLTGIGADGKTGRGAGGDLRVSFARVGSLAVGGQIVRDLQVGVTELGQLESCVGDLDGVLGFDFLSRFVLTIDYRRRQLELRRNE